MTDLIILATLLPGPKHGYQLKHEAGLIIGQQAIHNNLVYPLLRKFMTKGWVSKKIVPGERGQTRQQYTLTGAGRRALVERLSFYDQAEAKSADGFRLRVGLFDVLQPETRSHILEQREQYLRAQIEKFRNLQSNMELGLYGGEVVGNFIKQVNADLQWIEHLHRLIRRQQASQAKT
jgi:DNA-binding PadR family transcriptional regulator